MWCLTDPLDATVGLGDHSGKVGVGEVGQLAALTLEVGPQRLDGVQLGRAGGSRSATSQWRWLAMKAFILLLRWAGRPSHSSVASAPEEAVQLAEHADEGVGVVVAGLQVEGKLAAAARGAIADRGGRRGALPVERVD
jgi:hypothetical protein